MKCKMCKARGKNWEGSDPKCAFESGVFSTENWNCATMNLLRDSTDWKRRDDMDAGSIGVIHTVWGYLVMLWYKDRGRTTDAYIITEGEPIDSLDLELAEKIIGGLK